MLLPKTLEIQSDDILIGLPSSGVHSNGYSLVYHVMNNNKISYFENISLLDCENSKNIGEILLTPTKIYTKQIKPLKNKNLIKAMAHITGGGIIDNLPRILPEEFCAEINALSWPMLPIFKFLKNQGNIEALEMYKTFNASIGMILVIDKNDVDLVQSHFIEINEPFYQIGRIVKATKGNQKVLIHNMELAFE